MPAALPPPPAAGQEFAVRMLTFNDLPLPRLFGSCCVKQDLRSIQRNNLRYPCGGRTLLLLVVVVVVFVTGLTSLSPGRPRGKYHHDAEGGVREGCQRAGPSVNRAETVLPCAAALLIVRGSLPDSTS